MSTGQQTEKVYFSDRDFKVTSTRVVTPGETFALRNVVSVAVRHRKADDTWPILAMVLGVLSPLVGLAVNGALDSNLPVLILGPLGLVIAGIGLLAKLSIRSTYHVILSTAAGERVAIQSAVEEIADKYANAIEDAIASK
jgi:hypothetical protein